MNKSIEMDGRRIQSLGWSIALVEEFESKWASATANRSEGRMAHVQAPGAFYRGPSRAGASQSFSSLAWIARRSRNGNRGTVKAPIAAQWWCICCRPACPCDEEGLRVCHY